MVALKFKNGVLLATGKDKKQERVTALPCFPLQSIQTHISLMNEDGKEVLFVTELADLPSDQRVALEEALKSYGKNLEVQTIVNIEEDYELRKFEVILHGGKKRTFFTPLDEWPKTEKSSVIFEDIAGDIYTISEVGQLDSKSLSTLSPFIM